MHILVVQDHSDSPVVPQCPRSSKLPWLVLESAATAREAVARLRDADPPFDAAAIPLRQPGGRGLALVRWVRRHVPATAIVAFVGGGDPVRVLEALDAGADDCVTLQFDSPRGIAAAAERAVRHRRTQARRARPLRVLYGNGRDEDAPLRHHLEHHAPHLHLTRVPDALEVPPSDRGDVILLDFRSHGGRALELVRESRAVPVVLLVDPGEEAAGVHALRLGAGGYVVRHPGWLHQVPGALECAFARAELRRGLGSASEREQLLRIVFDSLSTRVMVLDRAGYVTYATRPWRATASRCETPICSVRTGESFVEVCRRAAPCDDDAARALDGMTAVLQGRTGRFEMEYVCRAPGDEQWFLLQATPMPPEHGGAVICHVNVTERRAMEEALRESHDRYALATAAGAVGLWDWNLETGDLFVDPALKALLGYSDREIRNHIDSWGRHLHPDDVSVVMDEASAHMEGQTPRFHVEHRMLHRDGSVRWFLARGAAERRPDGRAYRLVGTDTDVTERRRVEEALRASREELSRLAGRLMAAQEEERRRIARELHDDLNQRVAALGIGISRLANAPPEEVQARAAGLHAQVDLLADRIRGLSHRMHPAVLEHIGLVPALGSVCEDFERIDGIRTEFVADHADGPFPRELSLAVYRVTQEGLRNVSRHSGSKTARVTLTREHSALELVIADSGVGFDPAAVGPEGLGLVSMAERVHLLGGDFKLTSAPGAGTELRARFPLDREDDGEDDTDPGAVVLEL